MYERFNNNFQNIQPQTEPNIDPYQQQYFGENSQTPYIQGMDVPTPGALNQNAPYPLQPSLATPSLSTQISPYGAKNNYATGGLVKKKKKRIQPDALPSLAEIIRQQGEGNDQILAHINPEEAQMLAEQSGGDINPNTGLPQFGFWNNPVKWAKGSLGGIGGAILGNMMLPGLGGIIGGGLGGAAGSAVRGRKDYLQAGIRGAAMGAALPTVAGLAGSAATKLGAGGLGSYLTNYGNTNSIMQALGSGAMGNALNSSANPLSAISGAASAPALSASAGTGAVGSAVEPSFLDKLMKPKNLLTAGVLASSFLNRPKEKTPEQRANEEKRYHRALMLTPEQEAAQIAHEQSKRRISRNKFLPEERFEVNPLYTKTSTPEEYKRSKQWLSYYDNPEYRGNAIPMKKGGLVPHIEHKEIESSKGNGLSGYIKGTTGGQDDKRRSQLLDKSYVVDASAVADIGDGNSDAGAKKLDAYVSDGEYVITPDKVADKFGNGNNKKGAQRLDRMIRNIRKHKGGNVKLPPKAKDLASYMRG